MNKEEKKISFTVEYLPVSSVQELAISLVADRLLQSAEQRAPIADIKIFEAEGHIVLQTFDELKRLTDTWMFTPEQFEEFKKEFSNEYFSKTRLDE